MQLSTAAAQLYTPTSKAREFSFLHILTNPDHFPFGEGEVDVVFNDFHPVVCQGVSP